MLNFMYNLLKPNSGVSSKRFISVFGFLTLVFIALIDLFTKLSISDYVYEGLVFTILGGLGSTAAEAFSKRNDYKNINNNQQQPPGYVEPEPPLK